MDPLKIKIMDIDDFITDRGCMRVSSPFIKESSSQTFDQAGLFSEAIFGEIGTSDRLVQHGYIVLNTTLLNPEIFDVLMRMKSFYKEIVNGNAYAKFDNTEKDFVLTSSETKGSDTGYNFFIKNIEKVVFKSSDSSARTTRIKLLKNNKKSWFVDKCLVLPAGVRDYREVDGRGESDEINKIYKRVLEVSTTLEGSDTESPIFDSVRFSLQKGMNDVFEYIWEMISNKKGFIQKKYGARSVARATRNVLVAMDISSNVDNPGATLRADEVAVPLYQAIGSLMPVFKYQLKTIFFDPIFSLDSNQVSLVDPKTLQLSYVEVNTTEKSRFITSDKIEEMILTFRDNELRHLPVVALGADNKKYYLYVRYIKDGIYYVARSYPELRDLLVESGVVTKLDIKDVGPMTYYEMYYQACYMAAIGKHMTVTRYPVLHHLSIFPAKIHLTTTTNFTKMIIASPASKDAASNGALPRFPVNGAASTNGISIHPAQITNLNAD